MTFFCANAHPPPSLSLSLSLSPHSLRLSFLPSFSGLSASSWNSRKNSECERKEGRKEGGREGGRGKNEDKRGGRKGTSHAETTTNIESSVIDTRRPCYKMYSPPPPPLSVYSTIHSFFVYRAKRFAFRISSSSFDQATGWWKASYFVKEVSRCSVPRLLLCENVWKRRVERPGRDFRNDLISIWRWKKKKKECRCYCILLERERERVNFRGRATLFVSACRWRCKWKFLFLCFVVSEQRINKWKFTGRRCLWRAVSGKHDGSYAQCVFNNMQIFANSIQTVTQHDTCEDVAIRN